jgi:bifunctional DNase/RNase
MTSSALMYSAALLDESGQHLLVLGLEREEALALVAALQDLPLPRPLTINVMTDTLKLLGCTLEEARIESFSFLPPLYHLCSCVLRWNTGGTLQKQARQMRPGDMLALALLMKAPLFASEDLFKLVGMTLAEGETAEHVFARLVLRQEGITLAEGQRLRLGFSKTPLRDALVKEFKAALAGKAPAFPEEDQEQRKQDYLAFILGEKPVRV